MTPIRVDPLTDPEWHLGRVCSQCEGEGVWTDDPALNANDPSTWEACAPCNATGRISWGRVECGRCKGSGEILVPEHGGTPCGTDYCPDCFRSPVDDTVPVVVEFIHPIFDHLRKVVPAPSIAPGAAGIVIVGDKHLADIYAQIATLHDVAQVVIRLDSRESVERAGAWLGGAHYVGITDKEELAHPKGTKPHPFSNKYIARMSVETFNAHYRHLVKTPWPLPYVFYRVPAAWQALARELCLPVWEEAG